MIIPENIQALYGKSFYYNSHKEYGKHYAEVFERDGGICQLCGRPVAPSEDFIWHGSLDHIVPQSKGGSHDISNLRLAHVICNSIRQDDEGMNEIPPERLEYYMGVEG